MAGYDLRQSDLAPTRAERDLVVDRLQDAVSNGALTFEEFQERLDATYVVSTRGELQSLVTDLPSPETPGVQTRSAFGKRAVIGAAIAAVAIAVIVAATVGHSQRSPSAPSSGVSIVRAVDSCALLSSSRIDPVLGTASVRAPSRYHSEQYGWDECTYLTRSGSGPAVAVQAGTAISGFAARYKTTNSDLSGIGDQAALYTNLPGAAVLARQGSKWVDVYVEYLPVKQATRDAQNLAKAALQQLTSQ